MILRRRRGGPAAPSDGDRLAQAARLGDEAALAALRADLAPDELAALALALGLQEPDAGQVLAAARAAAAAPEAVDLLGRVVVLLLDGGGRSAAAVGELLALPVPELAAARAHALALADPQAAPPPGCRGWLLVSAADRLTGEERSAAEAHLEGCRRCSAARAAAAQAVRRVPGVPAPRSGRG